MSRLKLWYDRQPPALRALLTINVVIYIVWQFLRLSTPVEAFVWDYLALNPALPDILLQPWQLLTYNFLHLAPGLGGLIHIAFNMLFLYWIGKGLEEMHGSHTLMAVYILAGLAGGIVTVLLFNLIPIGLFQGIVHGASASVLGVLMTVAILYPYKKIALLLLGTIRLLYIVIGFLVLDLLLALGGGGRSVTAHWGGALGGFLLARAEHSTIDLTSWARVFFGGDGGRSASASRHAPRRPSTPQKKGWIDRLDDWLTGATSSSSPSGASSGSASSSSSSSSSGTSSAQEEEVDRILDKISEQGYDALTEKEKRILYEASKD